MGVEGKFPKVLKGSRGKVPNGSRGNPPFSPAPVDIRMDNGDSKAARCRKSRGSESGARHSQSFATRHWSSKRSWVPESKSQSRCPHLRRKTSRPASVMTSTASARPRAG